MCVAIIVHQESVCATFGSGLSSACVVDVGDQKTSLCCVEDGVSHRNSRLDTGSFRDVIPRRLICGQRRYHPVCDCFQGVSGVRRLGRDPYVLLAPTEGGLPLQRLSAGQQVGLPVAAEPEGDPLSPRTSVCWPGGWEGGGVGVSKYLQLILQQATQMCHEGNVIHPGHIGTAGS